MYIYIYTHTLVYMYIYIYILMIMIMVIRYNNNSAVMVPKWNNNITLYNPTEAPAFTGSLGWWTARSPRDWTFVSCRAPCRTSPRRVYCPSYTYICTCCLSLYCTQRLWNLEYNNQVRRLSMGNFPEDLSQRILVGIVLVGRLGVLFMSAWAILLWFISSLRRADRKGGWHGWEPSSRSNCSIRAYRLIEIRYTVPCRAIRGNSISVNGTLPPS